MKRRPGETEPEFNETAEERGRYPEEEPQSEVDDDAEFEPSEEDDIDEDDEDNEDTEPDR